MNDTDRRAREQARADADGWEGITTGFGTVLLLCGFLIAGCGAFCMGTGTIGVSWLLLDASSSSNPSGQQAFAAILGFFAAFAGLPLLGVGALFAVPGAGWLFAVYWGRWRSKVSHQD